MFRLPDRAYVAHVRAASEFAEEHRDRREAPTRLLGRLHRHMKPSRLRIIVTGLIAQHPLLGGVTWDYLQYVLGLARLGHDVYYFEDSGQWPYTLDGGGSYDCTPNVEHLARVMTRFGLRNRWAYHFPIKPRWFGLSHRERRAVLASADLLINVSGTLRRPQEYRPARRLVYIDSDPVFTQVKLKLARGHLKFRKRLEAHDLHFSFGESFSPGVPDTGHRWRPTRQPIVLSEWQSSTPRDVFTTVMNWTSYQPLRYRGQDYGQKDVELKRFLELPAKVRSTVLEVAVSALNRRTADWQTDDSSLPPAVRRLALRNPQWTPGDLLHHMGWRMVGALEVCQDLDRYRDYIQSSKAEWSVAKNGYVRGQAGWFSCRSACYLAAGKPVVVQDTGFGAILPVGEGILGFRTMEEAVAAIREVEGDYPRHAKAARAIAEEYFDSDKVLTRLIEQALSVDPGPAGGG